MVHLTQKQKNQLDDLHWLTIGPAIVEDLGIEPGSKEESDAYDYLIKLLINAKREL